MTCDMYGTLRNNLANYKENENSEIIIPCSCGLLLNDRVSVCIHFSVIPRANGLVHVLRGWREEAICITVQARVRITRREVSRSPFVSLLFNILDCPSTHTGQQEVEG